MGSSIKDTAVLDKSLAQKITSATLAALSLVPLAAVAWADRGGHDRERAAILSGAETTVLAGLNMHS